LPTIVQPTAQGRRASSADVPSKIVTVNFFPDASSAVRQFFRKLSLRVRLIRLVVDRQQLADIELDVDRIWLPRGPWSHPESSANAHETKNE
jgi:hypothetical protein